MKRNLKALATMLAYALIAAPFGTQQSLFADAPGYRSGPGNGLGGYASNPTSTTTQPSGSSGPSAPTTASQSTPAADPAAVAAAAAAAAKKSTALAALSDNRTTAQSLRGMAQSWLGMNAGKNQTQKGNAALAVAAAETKQNSDAVGDPVMISSGTFVLKESDLPFSEPFFACTRTHRSGTSARGSFGTGWTTSLDTRIIRGTSPLNQDTIASLNAAIATLDALYRSSAEIAAEYPEGAESAAAIRAERTELAEAAKALADEDSETNALAQSNATAERVATSDFPTQTGNGTLVLVDENGIPRLFIQQSPGIWTPQNRMKSSTDSITAIGSANPAAADGFIYRTKYGIERFFDKRGLLTSVRDATGREARISRDENTGYALELAYRASISYAFGYANGAIMRVTGPSGHAVSFGYHDGKLSSVTDADGDAVRYEYDGNAVSGVVKPDGTKTTIFYGSGFIPGVPATTKTKNEDGNEETFEYDPSSRYCAHVDYEGRAHRYWYDEYYRTVREEHDGGKNAAYEWDDTTGLLLQTIIDGSTTRYSYDARGNLAETLYADGSTEKKTYSAIDKPLTTVDRDGIVTAYAYDERGNCVSVMRGGTPVFKAAYDAAGNMIRRQIGNRTAETFTYDGNGFQTSRAYETAAGSVMERTERDATGNAVARIDGEGRKWTKETKNRKTTERYPGGLIRTTELDSRKDPVRITERDSATGATRIIEYAYNKTHKPIRVTVNGSLFQNIEWTKNGELAAIREGDRTISYDYDKAGRIKSIERSSANAEESRQTNIEYENDAIGHSETFRNNDGTATKYHYDEWMRLIGIGTEGDEIETRSYSPEGRSVERINRYGGTEAYSYGSDGSLRSIEKGIIGKTNFEWNADGTIAAETAPSEIITKYAYDGQGTIASIKRQGSETTFTYDKAGRILSIRRGKRVRAFSYANDDRTITVRDGGSASTSYAVDAWGNVVSVTDGEGNVRRREYDAQNKITADIDAYGAKTTYERDGGGGITASYPDGRKEEFRYDFFGNLIERGTQGHMTFKADYDANNNATRMQSNPGAETATRYDEAGRIIERKVGGSTIEEISYEDKGRMTIVKDANRNRRTYARDEFGRITEEKDPTGRVARYAYSHADAPYSKTNFSGIELTTEQTPDGKGNILRTSTGERKAAYRDESGNITRIDGDGGCVDYEYDEAGLLTAQTDRAAGETTKFSYDKAGRRIRMESSSRAIEWAYGKNGEVRSISDEDRRLSVNFSYDVCGREISRVFGNGARQDTIYDSLGRTSAIASRNPSGEITYGESYLYDERDRITNTITNAGAITSYFYDQQSRISEVWYPNSSPGCEREIFSQETVDAAKSAISLIHPSLAGAIMPTILVEKERFLYDGNGNCVERSTMGKTTQYTYDQNNRLTSAGDSIFSYDEDGNMVVEKNLRKTTLYTYNALNRMIKAHSIETETKKELDSTYEYDALGRRITTTTNRGVTTRSVYAGTGFDIIASGPTFNDSTFATSKRMVVKTNESTADQSSHEAAGRYRWFSEGDSDRVPNRGESSDDTSYSQVAALYPIYQNAMPIAQTVNGSELYFGTDIRGSVRTVCDYTGNVILRFDYDIFGTETTVARHQDNPPIEPVWTGKFQDEATGLYDYGYRDYSPENARFTTQDPIKDGQNWYAYANSDPVNFVDLWGLCVGDSLATRLAGQAINDKGGSYMGIPSKYVTKTNPTYFNQKDFSSDFGDEFGEHACAATSLMNELSEEYTVSTGDKMTYPQAKEAMTAAINSGGINSTNANINNWQDAANQAWSSTSLPGKASYNETGTHLIYAEDSDGDNLPDHFTNSTTPGKYYDPWTGTEGIVGDTPLQTGRPTRGFDFAR